ncbi:f071be4c-f60e-4cc2-a8a2-f7389bd573a0 [Thermothielavioides terrestris]|uniref:F071be4c-f60e-4cc2-a8a2-f7389bd573a0 n=1 Tax=Thermothielavioides terrestris TaxID=2587410 RepID=A0A3S4ANA2_9PEZI|nr:f071be4c-f60e-4cc2-a8a2-f7389bd573a0 [Thermothielavioides terrestris]
MRSHARQLDRDIARSKQQEAQAKKLILEADRRASRDLQRQAQARRDMRVFARELIRCRRMTARLYTVKAQLSSVQMQVNEAFAVRKSEGSIRAGAGVMRDVNALIRLPEFAGTMQELSRELIEAGIIEEMVHENLPEDGVADIEEEAAEREVDKVLGEVLKDRKATAGKLPTAPIAVEPVTATTEQEEEDDNTEAMMDQMRNRLEALRN